LLSSEIIDGANLYKITRPSESKSYAYKAVSMYIIIVSANYVYEIFEEEKNIYFYSVTVT
jgi:hypothetical protein